jgi:DNA-3-methyladenine glycosylase
MDTKLKKDFYNRNVLKVAEELLGKIFISHDQKSDRILKGRIVEVEAYDGSIDEAAHTFRGKTKRNGIMFEEGGHLYVYFTYGIHYCANVVAGKKDNGAAVLLRAMEPIEGIDIMGKRRFKSNSPDKYQFLNLLNGPAKICQAFEINKKDNGRTLFGNEIYILDSDKIRPEKIVRGKRIGIKKSVHLPWRFYIKDNPFVSHFRGSSKDKK